MTEIARESGPAACCPDCGKELPQVACPDKKPGCLVLHFGPCSDCEAAKPKAWLTTHATRGGKPSLAGITLNNIPFGLAFDQKYDGIGTQVRIQPMDIAELGILRDALNKYWRDQVNDPCGMPTSGGGTCKDTSREYHGH